MVWKRLIQTVEQHGGQVEITCAGRRFAHGLTLADLPAGAFRHLGSPAELTHWLGHQPERFHSRDTALAIAVKTFYAATESSVISPERYVAVGCVAGGDDPPTVWLSLQTLDTTSVMEVPGEELSGFSSLAEVLPDVLSKPERQDATVTDRTGVKSLEIVKAAPALVEVWQGKRAGVWRYPEGTLTAEPPQVPRGLLSGSFNPLHQGHQELRAVAEHRLGGAVYFEMTITNADKPPLDFLTVQERSRQFDRQPLWITNAPTFVEKAEHSPGTVFIVGADTAERIVQPRFYGNQQSLLAGLEKIREAGCRFLVAGRQCGDRFQTCTELPLPASFEELFEPLSATDFRCDVSSTELRRRS